MKLLVEIPDSLHLKLKVYSAKAKKKMKDIVIKALNMILKEEK